MPGMQWMPQAQGLRQPWLRKTGSENATEKMGSDSEQIGLIEKALYHL